jgi:arylsulfatase A-like enzyme
MKKLQFLYPFFVNSKYAFFFSLAVYLSSLVLNTSFRVMGFDLQSELSSAFQIDFLGILLTTHLQIFLLYFLFYASLQFILKSGYDILRFKREFYFPIFIVSSLFLWVDSVVRFPQVYADFFYGKHPYFLGILYFFTDYLPVDYNPAILAILVVATVSFFLFHFLKTFSFSHFVLIVFILGFGFFHAIGSFWGLLVFFFLAKYFHQKTYSIQKVYYLPVGLSVFLILFTYYYYQYLFSFQAKSENPYRILLVSADSLRKDRISKLRGEKSITPNLDEFLKDSFSFEDHHVTIPRTFPSWADLLTGRYSMSHKVRDMFPAPDEVAAIGSEEFPTLAQYLKKENVESGVFSNFAGDIFPRANFGFERVNTPTFNAKVLLVQKSLESQIFLMPILTGSFLGGGKYFDEIDSNPSFGDGRRVLKDLLPFIRTYKNRSFFATSFFSVTHFPYSPPYPYYKKYSNPNYKGIYKYFKFVDPTKDEKPSQVDIEQIESIFDASIHAFDSDFGSLIKFLHEENIYDETMIIVTGDHGESLYEDVHGHGHGEHLRGESVTHVPLIIKFPKKSHDAFIQKCDSKDLCQKIYAITSSIDILPTILQFYGIEPYTELPGRSLLDLLEKRIWKDDRYVYSETGIWFSDIGDHFFQKQRIMYPNILKLHRIVPQQDYQIMITDPFYRETIAFAKHRALLTSKLKLIYIPTHEGVLFEVYDRINDPLNQKNIYNAYTHSRLRNELYKLVELHEGAKIIGGYIVPPVFE